METYLTYSNKKSEKDKFEFIHHSTASVIQVIQHPTEEDETKTEMWFSYAGFEEFVDFMKTFKK